MSNPFFAGSGEVVLNDPTGPSMPSIPSEPNYIQSSAPLRRANTKKHTTNQSINTKTSSPGGNQLLKNLFLLLSGILISAIPLTIVSFVYVQEKGRCDTTATTTTASITASITTSNGSWTLPSQCFTYTTNNDSTRSVFAGAGALCDNVITAGWYRFVGNGTIISTTPVSINSCTTSSSGYFRGTMPSSPGTTTYGILCANVNGDLCSPTISGHVITVTNCDTYYVYYLSRTNCNTRYCTTN